MDRQKLKRLILSALFFAIAYLLPFVTGQMREIGKMLCPMHFPVLLCGLICGGAWGMTVGFTAPIFRSLFVGKPLLFPSAVGMAFELALYGLMAGALRRKLPKTITCLYLSLVGAMVSGRLVWGIVSYFLYMIKGNAFTLTAFWSGAVIDAVPGIILQIILIPPIALALERMNKRR